MLESSALGYYAREVAISCDQLCERVEHVGPLGQAERNRADPTVSPDRITRAFHCHAIARNYSNVPTEILLQHEMSLGHPVGMKFLSLFAGKDSAAECTHSVSNCMGFPHFRQEAGFLYITADMFLSRFTLVSRSITRRRLNSLRF
ncbi:hypothetical protein EVAR_12466_1 [Eumeta japonica]|uniref:Uncharacterized protein n=1 Tax=Eumeta variegata TaxID=151549 RepID=A0A4C1TPH1_EUMVA|nr:hypothetical protein EVAR_12466_1 [Eumeta japonica]